MRRLLLLALLLPAAASAAPARLGDVSVGAGPALVVDRGDVGPGAVAEANLLWHWLSLGLRLRGAAVDGEFRPAAGVELGALGLFGVGASIQEPAPSVDLLFQVPVPIYSWQQTYLTLGYRPSWLTDGSGWVHEIALQVKWSSLLVPEDD
ncbi:hypothetical protein [Vulgatibacter sp.]|uniref:hypothetical protein n=1 Tax=Vulgatibacter sp. TaxID=1971226 RepID=UPI0035692D1F